MIEFVRMTASDHPLFEQTMRLYAQSFLIHEQRMEKSQRQILSDPLFHADALVQDGQFCGLLFWWELDGMRYIEHFAVDVALRGQGIGNKSLSRFLPGEPVVLEIDPPVDELSCKRERFYHALGMQSNPFAHRHPPYRPQTPAHELVVLSSPRPLTEPEYCRFADLLESRVMADVM